MHRDAAGTLFDGERGASVLRVVAAFSAAILNATATTPVVPALVASAAVALLLVEGLLPRRAKVLALAGAWVVLLAVPAGIVSGDRTLALLLASKLWAGVAVAVWTGSTLSWPGLLWAARSAGVPEGALDGGGPDCRAGLLLASEVERRYEAATLRGGLRRGEPRLETWGRVVAGGVESAFERAVRLEEVRVLRKGSRFDAATPDAPSLSFSSAVVRSEEGAVRLGPIDLELARGEWVAVLGPSGSGKSTLLAAAAGLLPLGGGRLVRLGVPVAGESLSSRADRSVALVFQDPADQLLGSTPREDLLWGLLRAGAPEGEACQRAGAALEELGIAPLADRPVARLSFGERKRAACAAALSVGPELLLLDEPTSGLDPRASRLLADAVEAAAASSGAAVLWATHDVDVLPARVRRVLLLGEGRVVFDGPLSEGLAPELLHRAGLLAEPLESRGCGPTPCADEEVA
ncbi:MAG: ATP-binding cassette domain-containing protein [Holophagales bacterium]|nr:ATP-binding cassette domain-containing protein [Holophagales bacterium]